MKLLVDSHVLVWMLTKPKKISDELVESMTQPDSEVYISYATLWELALKFQKGKFVFSPEAILEGVTQVGAELLGIDVKHIQQAVTLDIDHKDPFDMLLCGQAQAENMTLITADKELLKKFPKSIPARS